MVAPLTTIGSGKVELGSHDLDQLTIGEVKSMIFSRFSDIPVSCCVCLLSVENFKCKTLVIYAC